MKQVATTEQNTAEVSSLGAMLKLHREEQGMTVQEVADKLKVMESYIRLIEEEEYSKLPGMTYVRGYILSYIRLLSLDSSIINNKFSAFLKTDNVERFLMPPLPKKKISVVTVFTTSCLVVLLVMSGLAGVWIYHDRTAQKEKIADSNTYPVYIPDARSASVPYKRAAD